MPCLDSKHPASEPHIACHYAMQWRQTLLEMELGLDSGQLCPMDHSVFTIDLIYSITEKDLFDIFMPLFLSM